MRGGKRKARLGPERTPRQAGSPLAFRAPPVALRRPPPRVARPPRAHSGRALSALARAGSWRVAANTRVLRTGTRKEESFPPIGRVGRAVELLGQSCVPVQPRAPEAPSAAAWKKSLRAHNPGLGRDDKQAACKGCGAAGCHVNGNTHSQKLQQQACLTTDPTPSGSGARGRASLETHAAGVPAGAWRIGGGGVAARERRAKPTGRRAAGPRSHKLTTTERGLMACASARRTDRAPARPLWRLFTI
jgi:hypothetical protein